MNDEIKEKLKSIYDSWFGATSKPKTSFTTHTINELDKAGYAIVKKDPWQPIETLKVKEGVYQLWHKRYGWIPSAQYVKDMLTHGGSKTGWLAHKDNTCHNEKEITHWQPLPEPPKE